MKEFWERNWYPRRLLYTNIYIYNLITVIIIGIINFVKSKYINRRNANTVYAVEYMIIVRMATISVQ